MRKRSSPWLTGDAEPVTGADRRLDLKQQGTADSEETAADAADAARPSSRAACRAERRSSR